jgi:hypothetical protein
MPAPLRYYPDGLATPPSSRAESQFLIWDGLRRRRNERNEITFTVTEKVSMNPISPKIRALEMPTLHTSFFGQSTDAHATFALIAAVTEGDDHA